CDEELLCLRVLPAVAILLKRDPTGTAHGRWFGTETPQPSLWLRLRGAERRRSHDGVVATPCKESSWDSSARSPLGKSHQIEPWHLSLAAVVVIRILMRPEDMLHSVAL